jgi:peptidoglycan-associated lipoprotein
MKSFYTRIIFILFAAFVLNASACRRGGRQDPGAVLNQDEFLTGWDDIGGIPLADERSGVFATGTPVAHSISPVYFAFDSYRIAASEMVKVQMAAEHLRTFPRDVVVVEGHTDERGSAEYNLALGERRALAVREALVGLGISPERIQTLSFGEERPAAHGTGEGVWSLNRRSEFRILR